jgi:N-methylhydantoinase A
MNKKLSLRLAVDIGGTFTDVVLVDTNNCSLATTKTATTPQDPTEGALIGTRQVIEQAGVSISDVVGFIHGTTLATNALIERRGAVVSTIATEGFRDILEIAYERRYSQYDISIEKPDFIVPRARSFTIPERLSVKGEILTPLDESAVDGLIEQLEAAGTEAVAICFLHAYANPVHEQRLKALLLERKPDLVISLSSEVSPEAREFERLCTTIANAYIQPLMGNYLNSFAHDFAKEGLNCPILMMTAGGGMTTLETAARFPIRLVESGPAGGAILSADVSAQVGYDRVLSFDMGGTTAKLCLIDNHQPQTTRQFEISRAARFIKGSGMPVRIPVIDMIEIGAGGGSIASVDRLGRLLVGPRSAGSEPGPAAFNRGGTEATVTDSDVALGYIDPDAFAEGRLTIDGGKANQALVASVGKSLSLDAIKSAQGVSQIVDEAMASAGRMHAVESGKDLGERLMIAFGGNGPLHATRVARRAGVNKVLIPNDPGVGSAVGFLSAPVSFELVRSRYTILDQLDAGSINGLFDEMIGEAETVVRAGDAASPIVRERTAFMRYHGQGHEIEAALPDRAIEAGDVDVLRQAFEKEYQRQFARVVPGMTIEILNWAVRVSTRPETERTSVPETSEQTITANSHREISCDLTGNQVNAAVFDRKDLRPGDSFVGPALVVEPQTTTLVSADFSAKVDGSGNLFLERFVKTGAGS